MNPGAERNVADIDRSTLGRPIKGPSALGTDPRRMVSLAWALAVTEFKLKFYGSALGYLWSILRPLLLFGTLLVVFTVVVKVGNDVPRFATTLLLGIVLFQFLGDVVGGAVSAIVDRENLVRKIDFPRMAVPLSVLLGGTFNLALNMVPVFIVLFAQGGSPRWSWLEMPLLLVLLAVFAGALAMIVSAAFVRFRDVRPIWDVVQQVMFYASGVLVPVAAIDSQFGHTIAQVMMMNPFATILEQARHAFVSAAQPNAVEAAGSWGVIAVPIAITAGLAGFGYWYFNREAPRVAERL